MARAPAGVFFSAARAEGARTARPANAAPMLRTFMLALLSEVD